MVRSPHPHARIVRIDTSAAKAMPGVLAVLTGADCKADGLKPIPHTPVPATRFDMKLTAPDGGAVFAGPHMLLPADKARHVGEAVAMVVAETRAQAMDAAEAVEVEYEELPFVVHSEDALKPGAPLVWDEIPGNVPCDTTFGDKASTDRAFEQAAHVVKAEFNIVRVTGVPMELRSCLAEFDAATGKYTLYAGSGGAVRQKVELAGVLGIPLDKLRVLSYDVGGNFGTRNRPFVEFGLVLWASGKLKRPVKYTATRSEAFLTDYQGRDLVTKVELAFDDKGRILAMRADNISNAGARCVSLSPLSKGSGLITGGYDIPAATLRARAVFTNTMPTNAYRSSGRPEVTFAIERLMDMAADQLGIDRIRIRRKNLVKPKAMPYRNAVGMLYDSGTYEANMDLAMKIADWDGFKQRKREAKKRGKLLGLGLANYVESSIGSPKERTEITVQPDRRGRRGDRHAAERPGPRDELRPGGGRPDRRAACGDQHHHRRHRHRQRRRRFALRPLDAPRRHGDFQGGAGADRQGQEDRGAGAQRPGGQDRVQRRPLLVADQQPQLRFPRTRQGNGEADLAARAEGRACRRRRQRDARSGVSERLRRSARSRSIPTPGRSNSPATPRSTTSAAASIR